MLRSILADFNLESTGNAPESFVTLTSPEVVTLDPSVIRDVLGLRTRSSAAGRTRVLPGRAPNSARALILDDRAIPGGFHDVTLVDLSTEAGPPVSMEEMCDLRRQWPTSVLTGCGGAPFRDALSGKGSPRILLIILVRGNTWWPR